MGIVNGVIGIAHLLVNIAGKYGAKLSYVGAKKAAVKFNTNNAIKIAYQKKAEAKALAAAKYKASLLSSHGIPAAHVVVKTNAGKAVYVVTHAKPVVVANGANKFLLTLQATGKGFAVKSTPIAAGAAKAGLAKGVLIGAGKAVLVGGGVIIGLLGGSL